MEVPLFKYLFNFKGGAFLKRDKRRAPRYPVGDVFPVKAIVALCTNRDSKGNPPPVGTETWQNWSGRLVNLSTSGAGIQLAASALANRGHHCRFKLNLDGKQLEMEGQIAYFRTFTQYSLCGLSFTFPDAATEQTFHQLLEMVMIGSSVEPAAKGLFNKGSNGMTKEVYQGKNKTRLSVWRNPASGSISHFEFRIHDYFMRGNAQSFKLELDTVEGENGLTPPAATQSEGKIPPAQAAEIRQMFRWIVANMTKSVPGNIRKFLEMFIK
jgi:PilZ domain